MTVFARGRLLTEDLTITTDPDGATVDLHDDTTLVWEWSGGVGPFTAVLTRSGATVGTFSTASRTVSTTAQPAGAWSYVMTVTDSQSRTATSTSAVTVTAPASTGTLGPEPKSFVDLTLSPGTVHYLNPSSSTPIASINAKLATMSAGDILRITPGTYTAESGVGISSFVNGTSNNWTTVMGDNGRVTINFTSNNLYACNLLGKRYIQLHDLGIIHTNPTTAQGGWEAGIFAGNGQAEKTPTNGHHYRITNCTANGWPTGIHVFNTDQWLVAGCVTNDNAWYHTYGGSGISANLSSTITASDPIYSFGGVDYRGAVIGCVAYNNHTRRQPGTSQWFSDGNGIILSDNQVESKNGAYRGHEGPFLAAHNVCVNNGGRGIQGYDIRRLTVVNNTCAYNGQHEVAAAGWGALSWAGGHEIGLNRADWGGSDGVSAYAGTQSIVANNLCIHEGTTDAWANTTTIESIYSNVIGANNYHVGANTGHTSGDDGHLNLTGDIVTGTIPSLESVTKLFTTGDYRPKVGSAVIDAGSVTYDRATTDISGNPIGATPDCGAYEYVAAA